MRLVLGSEIAKIDRMACTDYNISGLWLMENAGRAVAEYAMKLLGTADDNKPIVLLAGGGNNGGDALVVARLLAEAGYETETFLLCSPEKYQGDAAANWQSFTEMQLAFKEVNNESVLAYFIDKIQEASLIIDGIFGTGFHGSVSGIAAEIIKNVNECKCIKLAIDVPSGVNSNTGEVLSVAFKADYTVTFGWAKYGTKIYPAKDYVGEITVADIGLPKELLQKIDSDITEVDEDLARSILPIRHQHSHKGTYGHVAVVGGSYGMLGAPILASGGALKSGAGLVTAVSVKEIMVPLACKNPEIMTKLLATDQGYITLANKADIVDFIADKTVVMGMGMGRNKETQDFIHEILDFPMKGLVLDADGLYALAKHFYDFRNCNCPVVITPHPKEMALLLDTTTAQVEADRIAAAKTAAEKFGVIVVLKGEKTLVVSGNKVFLNSTGNAGMATGGSGDVLSGIIGGLLAQGLSPEQAAVLGVYSHGKAGDIAKSKLGEYGMSARDLIKNLPYAILEIEKNKGV